MYNNGILTEIVKVNCKCYKNREELY